MTELQAAVARANGSVELVAPQVGGVTTGGGRWVEAQQRIDGGPSVLYDAVALLLSEESARALCNSAAAVDFVSDAYAHCKYIGFVAEAMPLIQRCNVPAGEEGIVLLEEAADVQTFLEQCGALRVWSREEKVFAEPPAVAAKRAQASAKSVKTQQSK